MSPLRSAAAHSQTSRCRFFYVRKAVQGGPGLAPGGNMAHKRQSRQDSGLAFLGKFRMEFQVVPSLFTPQSHAAGSSTFERSCRAALRTRQVINPYTLHPAPLTLSPKPYTLHHALYTLHPTLYTLHPTPHTLHPAPFNQHPTPWTLHAAPDTLHPTPDTLHPSRQRVVGGGVRDESRRPRVVVQVVRLKTAL